jgi:Cys-tRNA(Pro)/Cys-tRNA(Cys) deacylase
MTPAIDLLTKQKVAHQVHAYSHDRDAASYGEEAAQKLGIDSNRVFKTLVVSAEVRLAVCVVPVSTQLDLKKAARALGVKKCQLAEAKQVERSTGYVLGGVSPIGQKRLLTTLVDASAQGFDTLFVSAGKRGLEIELAPQDLVLLTRGQFADIQKSP